MNLPVNTFIKLRQCGYNSSRVFYHVSRVIAPVRSVQCRRCCWYSEQKPLAHLNKQNSRLNLPASQFTTLTMCLMKMPDVKTSRRCWKCDVSIDAGTEMFFCKCGVVMKPDQNCDAFRLFGFDRTYDIDTEELSKIYKFLQMKLHPDKFTQKTDIEKQYSEEQSMLLNEAHNTLKKPISRGLYLLQLHGQPITEDDSTYLSQEFLEEIMKLNERLMDMNNVDHLKLIKTEISDRVDKLLETLASAFTKNDIEQARQVLLQLKYYDNIEEKIKILSLELK